MVHDNARARNNRIEYAISTCERNPKMCPVDNLRKCIKSVSTLINDNTDLVHSFGITVPEAMTELISFLYSNFDMTPDMCAAAEAEDADRFFNLVMGPGNSTFEEFPVYPNSNLTVNTESKPTDEDDESAYYWPFEDYKTLSDQIVGLMNIAAQDYAYGAYDEDTSVNFLFDLNKVRRIALLRRKNCSLTVTLLFLNYRSTRVLVLNHQCFSLHGTVHVTRHR